MFLFKLLSFPLTWLMKKGFGWLDKNRPVGRSRLLHLKDRVTFSSWRERRRLLKEINLFNRQHEAQQDPLTMTSPKWPIWKSILVAGILGAALAVSGFFLIIYANDIPWTSLLKLAGWFIGGCLLGFLGYKTYRYVSARRKIRTPQTSAAAVPTPAPAPAPAAQAQAPTATAPPAPAIPLQPKKDFLKWQVILWAAAAITIATWIVTSAYSALGNLWGSIGAGGFPWRLLWWLIGLVVVLTLIYLVVKMIRNRNARPGQESRGRRWSLNPGTIGIWVVALLLLFLIIGNPFVFSIYPPVSASYTEPSQVTAKKGEWAPAVPIRVRGGRQVLLHESQNVGFQVRYGHPQYPLGKKIRSYPPDPSGIRKNLCETGSWIEDDLWEIQVRIMDGEKIDSLTLDLTWSNWTQGGPCLPKAPAPVPTPVDEPPPPDPIPVALPEEPEPAPEPVAD